MKSIQVLRTALLTGAVALFAVGSASTASQAGDRREGAAIAGAIGGLAAGAALGAAANGGYYAAPAPAYPAYRERRVVVQDDDDDEECFVRTRRVWVDGYGWRVRRVRVCE